MAHAADIIIEAVHAADYGIGLSAPQIDFGRLCGRRDAIVSQLREGVEMLLEGVNIIHGEARFTGPATVEVNGETLTADRIIIATGSSPSSLPIPGAEFAITSDGLLSMESLPSSLAIIGAGVIGMEFASIFARLGVSVTVVEYLKEILPQFDKDMAKRLRQAVAATGVTFITGAAVTAIEPGKIIYTSGAKSGDVSADVIAVATGRRPNLPEGLDKAGIEVTERGAIKVDRNTMQTTADNVYAIGDVNGICMLAHAASAQARIVAGENVVTDTVPSVVFTYPEAAIAGMTEQQCKDAGMTVKSIKVPFRGNGKALTMGQPEGVVKLTVDAETSAVAGCQIIGPHAGDLIQEVAVVIANELSVNAITKTIHPHPTLCEAIHAAAMLY